MAGLLDLWDEIMRAKGPRPQNTPENVSSLIPQEDAGGLLKRAAMMSAAVPVVGDVMGLLSDAQMYRTKPEERTPGNFALTALGALPFVPAMAGTFAGVGAKTADVAALGKAQAMVKAKADPVEVWKATGWTDQFPDKKWRFEIPDNATRFNTSNSGENALTHGAGDTFLGPAYGKNALLEHPQLEAAYSPFEMAPRTFVRDSKTMLNSERGAFDPSTKTMTLYAPASVEQGKSTTLHELQHAVQQREGFASGGSPGMDVGMMLPQGWRTPEAEAALLAKQIKQWEGKYTKALDTAIQDAPPEIVPIARHWAKTKNLDELRQMAGNADYEGYRRIAGEAEARLTQARAPLTAAERRARPPWLEFDVPPEQQIVRGLLGQ